MTAQVRGVVLMVRRLLSWSAKAMTSVSKTVRFWEVVFELLLLFAELVERLLLLRREEEPWGEVLVVLFSPPLEELFSVERLLELLLLLEPKVELL